MAALGLRRHYFRELDFAKRMSEKFASPCTIHIIGSDRSEERIDTQTR